MFEPDVRKILIRLLMRSKAGEVKWLASEAAGMTETVHDDYVVLMPNSSINVFRDFKKTPRVNFIDSAGDVSLSLTADTDEDKELLEEIIASARQIVDAPKVSQTLDDIKKALKQEGVIGETNPRKFKEQISF
jgi:hypothetical protein